MSAELPDFPRWHRFNLIWKITLLAKRYCISLWFLYKLHIKHLITLLRYYYICLLCSISSFLVISFKLCLKLLSFTALIVYILLTSVNQTLPWMSTIKSTTIYLTLIFLYICYINLIRASIMCSMSIPAIEVIF